MRNYRIEQRGEWNAARTSESERDHALEICLNVTGNRNVSHRVLEYQKVIVSVSYSEQYCTEDLIYLIGFF